MYIWIYLFSSQTILTTIYKAIVTQDNGKEEGYIGLAGDTFKQRYSNHMKSNNHKKYQNETCLSSYIWKIKENGKSFILKWEIIERGTLFSPVTMRCNLCLKERYHLIFKTDSCTINNRNEFATKCKHIRPHIIENYKEQGD